MASTFMANLYSLFQPLVMLYLLFAVLFFFIAEHMMYFPPHPTTFKDSEHSLKIPLTPGNFISALYLPNEKAKYTVLVSHGNAEDLGSMDHFLNEFWQQGYAIFAYDYQGYGASTGKPTETNTYVDITAAYRYMTDILKLPADRIILFGRSLGTGPTFHLANSFPCKGMIVESPFLSAYRVKTRIPLFPFDKYKNLALASNLTIPTLVIQGTKDQVIPHWHGKKIYEALKGYKEAFWVKGADHNDILLLENEAYWQHINQFIHHIDKADH